MTSLLVLIIIATVLDEGFDVVVAGQGVVESCQQVVNVIGGPVVVRVW